MPTGITAPYVTGGTVEAVRKTTIYLPDSLERRMRQAAERLGMSRADITRQALEQYLDHSESRRGLPPSIGMGDNANTGAADYKERLARGWGRQ
jgi:ribbon-helix-helix CopG family protein